MRYLKIIINSILLGLVLISCSFLPINQRLIPEYTGVDVVAQPYVYKWMDLAKQNNLKFSHIVTVGFADIDRPPVVGQCNYGWGFREIDLENKYWNQLSEISKTILIFHELGHCYCERDHDYGPDKEYGDNGNEARKDPSKKDGFYTDSCPKSLMFPVIVDDSCFVSHYNDYTKELFQGCTPW